MYIRSHDGLGRRGLRLTYIAPGLADELVKQIEISPGVVNKLTDLVFLARHPERKGRGARGNRALVAEWIKIKNRLLKPTSAGNPAGFVIDLSLPQTDPPPDFSKTVAELGVWEVASIKSKLPFKFATGGTVMPGRRAGSFVSMVSLEFDNPQFVVSIAKHLDENASDTTKPIEYRQTWRRIRAAVREHAYAHLAIFRRASEAMENTLQELFNRLLVLPSDKKPLAVSKQELDMYLHSLGKFIPAIVQLELWEKTCDWEKRDYPKLSQNIRSAGAFLPLDLEVNCGPKPDLPDLPVPPVPIRPK